MRQPRLAFAALLVLSSLLVARPAKAEEPVTTPHPALVVGVVNDVLAVVCLAAGTPFAAAKDGLTGGTLLGAGAVYAISGIISTVHGATNRRELPLSGVRHSNVLTTTGASITAAGIAMLTSFPGLQTRRWRAGCELARAVRSGHPAAGVRRARREPRRHDHEDGTRAANERRRRVGSGGVVGIVLGPPPDRDTRAALGAPCCHAPRR